MLNLFEPLLSVVRRSRFACPPITEGRMEVAERTYVGIPFPKGSICSLGEENTVANTIKGKVIDVDKGGSLITDIASSQLVATPRDISVRITVDEHETFGLFPEKHDQPSMTLVAIVADDDRPLKIELVDDSASAMLGVRAGAPVEVVW